MTGNLAAATKTYISGIDYAAHGAIEEMTYGGGTVRKQRYCYNNRLQMSGMVVGQNPASNCASADTTLMRLFMGYGAANNGNLESQDIAADGFLVRQNYTYDKLNRLETAIEATLPTAGSTGWKQTNGYDRWGNRWVSDLTTDTYPANLTAQANSASWFTAKNRMNLSGAFDNAGNQTIANGFTLSYDAENRLASAVHGANTSKNQVYSYDSDGQRVKQVSGTGGTTLTTYFVYDAMGGLAAEYEVKTGGYPTPAAQCTTCYLAQDHLGSTRALWDESGVKARFDFLPFGEAIAGDRNGRAALTCAAGVANCYNTPGSLTQKFTGKERDVETGLDYFVARYVSSVQGRFNSPDPLLTSGRPEDAQSWNRFAYVRNNPLRFVDPTGLDWVASGKADNPYSWVDKCENGTICYKSIAANVNGNLRVYGSAGDYDVFDVSAQNVSTQFGSGSILDMSFMFSNPDAHLLDNQKGVKENYLSVDAAASLFNTSSYYHSIYPKDDKLGFNAGSASTGLAGIRPDGTPAHRSHYLGQFIDVAYMTSGGKRTNNSASADASRMNNIFIGMMPVVDFGYTASPGKFGFPAIYDSGHVNHLHLEKRKRK